MSLKSFDKFCETLIMAEPGSQKVILDERQRQVRLKLVTEAVSIYGIASFLNTAVMDRLYKWCDSFFAPMLLIAAVCYLYWILRCGFKGALFGVNGLFSAKVTAWLVIIQAFVMGVNICFDFSEKEKAFFYDGMLSTTVVCGITVVIFLATAVSVIILVKKSEKAERDCGEDSTDD